MDKRMERRGSGMKTAAWEIRMRNWSLNGLCGSLRMAQVAFNRAAQLEKLSFSDRELARICASSCGHLILSIQKAHFKKFKNYADKPCQPTTTSLPSARS